MVVAMAGAQNTKKKRSKRKKNAFGRSRKNENERVREKSATSGLDVFVCELWCRPSERRSLCVFVSLTNSEEILLLLLLFLQSFVNTQLLTLQYDWRNNSAHVHLCLVSLSHLSFIWKMHRHTGVSNKINHWLFTEWHVWPTKMMKEKVLMNFFVN